MKERKTDGQEEEKQKSAQIRAQCYAITALAERLRIILQWHPSGLTYEAFLNDHC